jgi:hypothetical protein
MTLTSTPRSRATRLVVAIPLLASLLMVAGPSAAAPSVRAAEAIEGGAVHQESTAAARYRWRTHASSRAIGGSYEVERTAGAQFALRFSGDSVTWYTVKGPNQGIADVSIDGIGKGSFNNYSSAWTFDVSRTFGGLGAGGHTLRITVTGARSSASTDTRVAVDAIEGGGTWYSLSEADESWRTVTPASGPTYAKSDLMGSFVDFSFTGTGVDWYTIAGPKHGTADLLIDGTFVRTVDTYASSKVVGVRHRVSGLADGPHVLRVRVTGERRLAATGTVISVDRWEVLSGTEPPPDPGNQTTLILDVPHRRQETNRWCVAASVQMHLLSMGWSSPSQQTLYDYGLPRKRCNVGIDSGLDPLAWAEMLYRYSPAGYYYDDYTYSSAYSGTRAMIEQLHSRSESGGALVNRGHHAFVFNGATTSCDPGLAACRDTSYTINTVYVNDPWYNRSVNSPGADPDGCAGTGGRYTCGRIGLRPNAAISWSTWKNYYFTTWGNQPADCAYWNGKWVAVLRKPSGVGGRPTSAVEPHDGEALSLSAPKDAQSAPTEQATEGTEYTDPAVAAPPVSSASAALPDLDRAFRGAIDSQGLRNRSELRPALEGGHLARLVRVDSLSASFPDYLLASVVGQNGLRGVAMFTLEGRRPTFAGMTYSDEALPAFPLVSGAAATRAVTAAGLRATGVPRLVWGWSDESNSPYYPFYEVVTDAGLRYVDAYGDLLTELHVRQ